jgi:hypothetical protein
MSLDMSSTPYKKWRRLHEKAVQRILLGACPVLHGFPWRPMVSRIPPTLQAQTLELVVLPVSRVEGVGGISMAGGQLRQQNMSTQESKDHRLGLKLAETLGIKREGNLYRTSWGMVTPIRLVRSLRNIIKETK